MHSLRLSRLIPALNGLIHYGNPVHIAYMRTFRKNGLMTISDRRTGVTVTASVRSYQMFGETWYNHDYDVPGCELRPHDSVIDIGANQGFFSCYAASKGARVYAFEPFPESCGRLRANIDRNGFSSRVTISETAVSSSAGNAQLLCSDFLGGGANTLIEAHANSIPASRYAQKSIEVDTAEIDAIIAHIPERIRLCKMDCEGAEYDILQSLVNPSKIDSFAIEFHPDAYQLRNLVAVMVNWRTHHISFAKKSNIMYAVRNDILAEYADLRGNSMVCACI